MLTRIVPDSEKAVLPRIPTRSADFSGVAFVSVALAGANVMWTIVGDILAGFPNTTQEKLICFFWQLLALVCLGGICQS